MNSYTDFLPADAEDMRPAGPRPAFDKTMRHDAEGHDWGEFWMVCDRCDDQLDELDTIIDADFVA